LCCGLLHYLPNVDADPLVLEVAVCDIEHDWKGKLEGFKKESLPHRQICTAMKDRGRLVTENVFPFIAKAIDDLYRPDLDKCISRREIAPILLRDAGSRALVNAAYQKTSRKLSKSEYAGNLVQWFSRNWTDGNEKWESLFKRFKRCEKKIDGCWAYKPIAPSAVSVFSDEAAPDVIRNIEIQIERLAGFQPNKKIRKAVEMHAMSRAKEEFIKRGYAVTDVSKKRPYDLECIKSKQAKYVEVKGAQGEGTAIVLTAKEVKFIKKNSANSILCVVHGIRVKSSSNPKASGGNLSLTEPFDLSDGQLKPYAFTFRRKK
jgi:hypothetical protein